MKEWALITGASSGIGLEFARVFAAGNFNLVLLARSESRLKQLADELRAKHQIETRVLVKDLRSPSAPQEVFDALRDTPISILVNNAGIGFHGAFAQSDLHQQTDILQLNINALVQLTHLFLKPMLARKSGRIMNVASTAAFQPGPWINVYYASKAFVFSFSYALDEELKGSGVKVSAFCPGPTTTDFFKRGNFDQRRTPMVMDARTVAELGYRGLMKGKRIVIPGWINCALAMLAKQMPRRLTNAVVRKVNQPR
jgi:short-subunit dehydrogenase